MPQVRIANHLIGNNQPCFIVAEIGINHNGDIDLVKQLIDIAKLSGCNAIKLQKRTPEICVPPDQRDVKRDTPWGVMTYLQYRRRLEFSKGEYIEIDRYCKMREIHWFASCWDEEAVEFIEEFDPPCYKVASASVTDGNLLKRLRATRKPIILSTGMSTMEEIHQAVSLLDKDKLVLCHSTSTYPCKPYELNLRMIQTLQKEFTCPVGYSGHEVGLQTTYAAVVLGACLIERHVTIDRAMWGSDQAASIEPGGLLRLVRDVRIIEKALGDGVKRVYESERPIMARLRRVVADKIA